jgi:hypothetical protein
VQAQAQVQQPVAQQPQQQARTEAQPQQQQQQQQQQQPRDVIKNDQKTFDDPWKNQSDKPRDVIISGPRDSGHKNEQPLETKAPPIADSFRDTNVIAFTAKGFGDNEPKTYSPAPDTKYIGGGGGGGDEKIKTEFKAAAATGCGTGNCGACRACSSMRATLQGLSNG